MVNHTWAAPEPLQCGASGLRTCPVTKDALVRTRKYRFDLGIGYVGIRSAFPFALDTNWDLALSGRGVACIQLLAFESSLGRWPVVIDHLHALDLSLQSRKSERDNDVLQRGRRFIIHIDANTNSYTSAIANGCDLNLLCQFAGKTSQGVAGENRPVLR